jgi:hypothetical protein
LNAAIYRACKSAALDCTSGRATASELQAYASQPLRSAIWNRGKRELLYVNSFTAIFAAPTTLLRVENAAAAKFLHVGVLCPRQRVLFAELHAAFGVLPAMAGAETAVAIKFRSAKKVEFLN